MENLYLVAVNIGMQGCWATIVLGANIVTGTIVEAAAAGWAMTKPAVDMS